MCHHGIMLQSLTVQGLALIDSLQVEFESGFNVLTGETGSGKSILIRALQFIAGGKVSTDMLREGVARANATGRFLVKGEHPALLLVSNHGIPWEEVDGHAQLLLRRSLSNKGKAEAWVNDTPVTLATLKAIGSTLIDLFGQHENQRLMKESEHLRYVDSFLADKRVLENYRAQYVICRQVKGEITQLEKEIEELEKHRELACFRLEELEKFAPTEKDFASLKEFTEQAQKGSKSVEASRAVLEALGDADGVSDRLKDAIRHSHSLNSAIREELIQAKSLIEEAQYQLSRQLEQSEFSEEKIDAAQERLYHYQQLFRKCGVATVTELVRAQEELSEKLNSFEKLQTRLAALKSEFEAGVDALVAQGEALSRARRKASDKMKSAIEKELKELAMPQAHFASRFQSIGSIGETPAEKFASLSEAGAEQCQFLLSANPGESAKPLVQVASGGELSRIMLAMKRVLTADADTCVLIFDEIDTGISGKVADVVGRKMQGLSKQFQVLCVSHLAQVAAYADAHFRVEKVGKSQRTQTVVRRLSESDSAEEIARILSGEEVMKPGIEQAKLLKNRAQKTKNLQP